MNRILILIFSLFVFLLSSVNGQDLMDLLEENEPQTTEYAYATFKTTRIVNGQSIENPPNGAFIFIITHHFDQGAAIRFGFEYGINDWLAIGLGRSSYKKTYDGFVKAKILRQSTGLRNMPVSLSYWGNMAITSLKWSEPERKNYFSSRMEYAHQLILARKFGNAFSLQLMPTYIHRNLVETKQDQNDVWAIGAGGRVKISNRVSINAEYYYLLPGQTADDFYNSCISRDLPRIAIQYFCKIALAFSI